MYRVIYLHLSYLPCFTGVNLICPGQTGSLCYCASDKETGGDGNQLSRERRVLP